MSLSFLYVLPRRFDYFPKISWGHLRCHAKTSKKHQIAVHYKLCHTLRHALVHTEDKTLTNYTKLDNAVYDVHCRQNVFATRERPPAHWSQIMQGGERRVCFLWEYVTSFKMDQLNLHLLITEAIVWTFIRQRQWNKMAH